MKRGRIVILGRYRDRDLAARLDNGMLTDLLVDPADDRPLPGAIYRARTLRPLKGQGGLTVDLGGGARGYLRQGKGIAPGTDMLVQVATVADHGKATPVTGKLLFKSRYAIVTPGAPGINVARSLRDEAERDRLLEIGHDSLPARDHGLIIRSAAGGVADDAVADDVAAMASLADQVLADRAGEPDLLLAAPTAAEMAWRDWVDPDPDEVLHDSDALDQLEISDAIDALFAPQADLPGGASMMIEPTTALVAVDVNTGADMSFAAGLKANLAVARDLPRQLRLRGLGGQIVIDMAPMAKKHRREVADVLTRALRTDGIDTAVLGWTALGHLELQRKRARVPLIAAFASERPPRR